MSIGDLNTNGNKGTNFTYQHSVLDLLAAILAASGGGGGGGGCPCPSSNQEATQLAIKALLTTKLDVATSTRASEATLLSILTTLQSTIDFEQNLVIDQGGAGCPAACPTYLQVRVWNGAGFNPPIYYDVNGVLVVPVGPVEIVNPQYVLQNILLQETAIAANTTGLNLQATQLLIKGDTAKLDVLLSSRATEATLILVNTVLNAIKLDTANLDVALSTRLSDATFTTRINTLGQKSSANSTPVVIASDQSTLPISAVSLPLPTGAATEVTLALVKAKTDNLDVLLSTRATEATLLTRATEATLLTRATEATLLTRLADATFTARLNTLGQKAMVASAPVVIASDQSAIPVTGPLTDTQLRATPVAISIPTSTKQTYACSIFGLLPAATPTDIVTIIGSVSKTIRIRRVILSATKTASGVIDVLLVKRSTANTGGTSSVQTLVPYDSLNVAATAVVRSYTANPTLGTLVGNIAARKYFVQGGTAQPDKIEIEFTISEKQAPTLRGVAEQLSINLNATAVTMAGALFDIYIEFTEE